MNPTSLAEFFATVVSLSWRAAWLIAVLAALRLAVRGRVPAQVWFVAWIVVTVRLLLPFSVPTGWSPYNFSFTRTRINATAGPVSTETVAAMAPNLKSRVATLSPIRPAVGLAIAENMRHRWTRREILAVIWASGVVLLLGTRLAGVWVFHRRLRNARPIIDDRATALVKSEAASMGVRRQSVLLETEAVDAPALYGFVRPWLLLPPGLGAKLTDGELRHVIRHELGHWRRRDLATQALMQAAVMVHWFNPLAWLAARLARVDCELACDEFVLRRETGDDAEAYGVTLLKVLRMVGGGRRPAPVVAMLEGREQLTHRIRMIAGYRTSTTVRMAGGVALIALLAVVSTTRETWAEGKPGAPNISSDSDRVGVGVPMQEYAMRPGDLIRVQVAGHPEINEQGGVRVSPGLTVELPLIGVVELGGRTTRQAQELIQHLYEAHDVRDPRVSITILAYALRNESPRGATIPKLVSEAKLTIDANQTAEIDERTKALKALALMIDQQKRTVDVLAHRMQDSKEKNGQLSPDLRADILVDTLKALNLEASRASIAAEEAQARLNQVGEYRERGADLKNLSFIGNQPLVVQLTQQLVTNRITIAGLSQRYTEKHPLMMDATNTGAAIEKELQRAVDSAVRQVEADYQSAQRNMEKANSRLVQAKSEAMAFDREMIGYRSLERELQAQEQILQSLTARARETETSMILALPSTVPVRPSHSPTSAQPAGDQELRRDSLPSSNH